MTQEPNSRSDQLAVTTENALLPRSSPAPGVPFDSSSLRLRKQTPAGSSEVGSLGRLDTPPAYIWLLIGCLSWSEHRWRGLRLRFQRRCQLSLVCCCYLLFAPPRASWNLCNTAGMSQVIRVPSLGCEGATRREAGAGLSRRHNPAGSFPSVLSCFFWTLAQPRLNRIL